MSALGAEERLRYARQLLVPEIGLAGQVRLCAARVVVPEALAAWATPYLAGAGLRVVAADSLVDSLVDSTADSTADAGAPPAADAPPLALANVPSATVERAITASWFAVETIKRELGLALASPDALSRALADLERTLAPSPEDAE